MQEILYIVSKDSVKQCGRGREGYLWTRFDKKWLSGILLCKTANKFDRKKHLK